MKDKIFKWIDNSVPLAVELETELTKRPAVSPESGGEGELDKCLFLEEWLKSHGITQLERYDAPDPKAKGGIRPNLIAVIPGADETKERLWIMSHLDVVPPGEEKLWTGDPWTVIKTENSARIKYPAASSGVFCSPDEMQSEFNTFLTAPRGGVLNPSARIKLTGRGVEDNQQGLVSGVLAALAFIACGIKPERTINLLFVSDEEVGSVYGIEWLVKNHRNLFKKNDMVLVPDGGDPKGELIEVAEKNILWVKFTVTGKQAHGSKPDLGTNAFLAGSELALCLHYELSAEFSERDPLFDPDYSTFQPTKKEANVPNINTIPGQDIFYMDMRVLPMYSVESIFKETDNIKAIIEEKHGVTVEYEIIQKMESNPTNPDALIVQKLNQAIPEVYAINPKPMGIGGGTVAAHLRNIGIDCAVWTKTDQTLHQPDEYVLMENILGDAKVMALLVMPLHALK